MLAIAAGAGFNPNDPRHKTLIDEATATDAAVTTAEGGFPQTDKPIIADWEVAVPAPVIALAADVFRAEAIVDRVQALTPTGADSVAKALEDADDDLADAIEADAEEAARVRAAADARDDATDILNALAATADQRLAAAVRGDD